MRGAGLMMVLTFAAGTLGARAADVAAPGDAPPPIADQQIYQIDSLTAFCEDGNLHYSVGATASTPGWTFPSLVFVDEVEKTANFKLMGTPPSKIVTQVLTPWSFGGQMTEPAPGIAKIHVEAASNSLDADVTPPC